MGNSHNLDDKYTAESGSVFMSGTQALVRLPMAQMRRDKAQGLNTAAYVTGYRGSPLGAYDQQLTRFGLSLSLLDEDERLSQTMTLSNGAVVSLGREERDFRMSRFLDVYERIAANAGDKPLSFDMRYGNGFALRVDDPLEDVLPEGTNE